MKAAKALRSSASSNRLGATSSSGKSGTDKKEKKDKQQRQVSPPPPVEGARVSASSKTVMSPALAQAMVHVKEFMTDIQKALILLREGKLLLDSGDPKGAIDCLSEGISLNPTVVLFNNRATCYKQLDMFAEAYFDYSYCIRLEPEVGGHFCNRGLCLSKMHKFSMAVEDLDIAIVYDPSAVNYYARASIYAEFGRHELAINDYSAALVEDPSSQANELRCRYKRALSYFEIENYEECIRDTTAMLLHDANHIPARSLLGRALKITNDHKKAEEHLTHAIILDEVQASLYVERGDIRFRTGQKNKIIEAIYDFDKAVNLLEQKLGTRNRRGDSFSGSFMAGAEGVTTTHTTSRIIRGLGMPGGASPSIIASGMAGGGVQVAQPNHRSSSMSNMDKSYVNAAAAAAAAVAAVEGEGGEGGPESSYAVPDSVTATNASVVTDNRGADTGVETGVDAIPDDVIAAVNNVKRAMFSSSSVGVLPPITPSFTHKSASFVGNNSNNNKYGSMCSMMSVGHTGGSGTNVHSTAVGVGPGPGAAYYADLEEQLADAYYKRAQTKLICDQSLPNIEDALADAERAISFKPDDDDYQMVASTCYIRLDRFEEANAILEAVLERSPANYKALYNYSFCQRARGQQKSAIEGLTKIISNSLPEMQTMTAMDAVFPIHRAFEMRGTLFHEIQAHKLALQDLGKAIAINSSRADNYFLRGDCLCKLGHYEQALKDYNLAEEKGFADTTALLASRGGVHRLLGNSQSAYRDFSAAHDLLDPSDRVGRVRIISFKAFCLIDQCIYDMAHDSLVVALKLVDQLINEKINHYKADVIAIEKVIASHIANNHVNKAHKPLTQLESDILYLKRINFILNYHLALCLYMQADFEEAIGILDICLSDHTRKFVSDDMTLGVLFFFRALTEAQLRDYKAAEEDLVSCGATHFVNSSHNVFLMKFTKAKLLQAQSHHKEAIETFSICLELDHDNPYCHFRRAWSYKALGDYVSAGDDFEISKRLRPDDPNFAVDYKRIAQCEYMIIDTEPDLVEKFPPLLPVPGFAKK